MIPCGHLHFLFVILLYPAKARDPFVLSRLRKKIVQPLFKFGRTYSLQDLSVPSHFVFFEFFIGIIAKGYTDGCLSFTLPKDIRT